jgi:hypothetical protein
MWLNMNKAYYIPYAYFISTRLKRPEKIASWIVIYPLALVLITYLNDANFKSWLSLLLGMTATYNIYELGYLQNDVVTTKTEVNPTLRLDKINLKYVENHIKQVVFVRLLVTTLISVLLYYINEKSVIPYLTSLLLIMVTFSLYNSIRSIGNIPLHCILVTLRFCGPLTLITLSSNWLFAAFLVFPLINTIERSAELRYGIKFMQTWVLTNSGSGRWIYYMCLSTIYLVLAFSNIQPYSISLIFFYFLVYRITLDGFTRFWGFRL